MNKLWYLLFVMIVGLGVVAVTSDSPVAQTKTEICDNGIDDDGDKLVDCEDPDCEPCKPDGDACSPGYWKNHTEIWYGICADETQSAKLLADLQARGPGSNEIRQAAADFLEACLGRPCND